MNEFGVTATALRPAQVFEGRFLRIPSYQRGYAWHRQQWDEFIEDLELLPVGRVHYTGTVVLHACAESAKDRRGRQYKVFEIVDGQQRLTTVVLLLDAIRRELVAIGSHDLAEGITETFISIEDRTSQRLSKLTLDEQTHQFFVDHILNDRPSLDGNRTRAQRNLSDAKVYFAGYLRTQREALGGEFPAWLEQFQEKLSNQLSLTVYAVSEESDAGVIFEVMNNRGKPITELEKVKNYLLYLSSKLELGGPHDLPKRINDAWAHMFRRLMSSDLASEEHEDQLLRVHWLMTFDPAEKDWRGSKSLKQEFHLREFVGRHEELLARVIGYVEGLKDATTAYCDVANPRHPEAFSDYLSDSGTRMTVMEAADKLPRLRTLAPFLPYLIAIRLRHPKASDIYLAALRACERYAFRVYRLLQRRSNAGRSSLFLVGHSLFTGLLTPERALRTVTALTLRYSPASEFERAFDLSVERDWYRWVGLKYFLYEYERYLADIRNKSSKVSWSKLEAAETTHTVEHILPQTPNDPYWNDRFDAESRRRYTHDIGNLCLTLDNSSYGNKPFPEKRGVAGSDGHCYATGDLVMERDLAAFQHWDEQALLVRRSQIMAWALNRWGIEADIEEVPEVGVDTDSDVDDDGTDVEDESDLADTAVENVNPTE